MILQEKQELINKHLNLVLQANKVHNLTTITDIDNAKIMHIEDSLAGINALNSAPEGKLIDMGSGAGYPGIPLAIATNRITTLVESVSKKADCLNSFVSQLNIDTNIFVSNQRIENHAIENRNSYTVATARALSSLTSLMELSAPLLKVGGLLVAYKGEDIKEELQSALKVQSKLGMKFVSDETYKLSNGVIHRIVVFKKCKESEVKLPRKLGLSQKSPIK